VPADRGKDSKEAGVKTISNSDKDGGIEIEGESERAERNNPLMSSLKATSLDR
jgi:hypothetical protein